MTIRSSVLSLFGAALVSTLLLIPVLSLPAHAQRGEGPLNTAQPQGQSPDEIVRRFAAKEKEFKEARENYTYRQSVKVQTLDGDTEDGEYQMVYDVTFDNQGRKQQHVVFAPQSTLQRIGVTKEDLDDIENRLPFVLTSDEIPEYDILYVGQQRQDELVAHEGAGDEGDREAARADEVGADARGQGRTDHPLLAGRDDRRLQEQREEHPEDA